MRCLYCGKELALLKRWTGGGEFCSDAHRQQYQEEYNQLALTRLLQAKPQQPEPARETANREAAVKEPAGKQPVAKSAPAREAATVSRSSSKPREIATPAVAIAPEPEPEPISEPVLDEPIIDRVPEPEPEFEPELEPEPEEAAPAEISGFLVEIPVPVLAEVMAMSRPDVEFENSSAPELPRRLQLDEWASQWSSAGRVELAQFGTFVDCAPRGGSERRLEVREFARSTPIVQVDLSLAGDALIPAMTEEPLEIAIAPQPPEKDPELWSEGWRQFSFEQSLGALARVPFRTTGLEDNEDAADPIAEGGEVEPVPVAAHAAPVVEPVRAEEAVPEPEIVEEAAEQVIHQAVEPEPAIEQQAVAGTPQESSPTPVTKPMPLTLHGLAAGRGKPVQVFTAVASAVEVYIPRSTALPLRPVMTLGPAPAVAKAPEETPKKAPEKTVVVKVDPKKAQPAKPDPRFANGKGKKDSQPEKPAQSDKAKKEVEQKPAASVAAAIKDAAVKEVVKDVAKEDVKPAVKGEAKSPAKTDAKSESSTWKEATDKLAAEKTAEKTTELAEKSAKKRESSFTRAHGGAVHAARSRSAKP